MSASGSRGPRKFSESDLVQAITSQPNIRLFLIFGQDESAIADICSKLAAAVGDDAERIDMDSGQIDKDPAILADEASSLSLFGGKRFIRLVIRREEALNAFTNLLEAEHAGNVVIASAGDLKKTSKIRKLGEASPLAITHICYPPSEADAAAAISRLASENGLRLDRALAMQISRSTGQDRRLAAMEVEKLALYYDAMPGDAKLVDADALEALSADNDEENVQALVDRVMGGDLRMLGRELAIARQTGVDAIRIIRALQRRIAMLTGLRSKVDGGLSPDNVVNTPSIFWKEKASIASQLRSWPSARLAALNGHLLETEKKLMSVKAELGSIILEEELAKISRAAARSR